MKLLKRHRVTAADLARRYVEFHDDKPFESISLWGLEGWQYISKSVKEGVIIPARTASGGFAKGQNWYIPSQEFLEKVVVPFIAIYRNDVRSDRNGEWFEGKYPPEIWAFETVPHGESKFKEEN